MYFLFFIFPYREREENAAFLGVTTQRETREEYRGSSCKTAIADFYHVERSTNLLIIPRGFGAWTSQ